MTWRLVGGIEPEREHYLESALTPYVGRVISRVSLDDSALELAFADDTRLRIVDAPDCCEHRWLHTDDDLRALVGQPLLGVSLSLGPEQYDVVHNEVQECAFMRFQTPHECVTVVAHNNHTGYYDGIHPRVYAWSAP